MRKLPGLRDFGVSGVQPSVFLQNGDQLSVLVVGVDPFQVGHGHLGGDVGDLLKGMPRFPTILFAP